MGCCCGDDRQDAVTAPGSGCACDAVPPYIVGWHETPAGKIPRVDTRLGASDLLGALRVRLAISRMNYRVEPGLYALGTPQPDSPILVTANYKLTFDCLRRELGGRDLWLLILDTKGVNVWCAAGKGTFGTEELLQRLEVTRLAEIVARRELILPQLGAPGVAAHEVARRGGFRVVYGPVRAADLPAFLDAGLSATAAMRRVRFGFFDRLKVVPVELVTGIKYLFYCLLAVLLFSLVCGFSGSGGDWFSWGQTARAAGEALLAVVVGYVIGAAVTPVLLPWLPGRAFALKGAVAGILAALAFVGSGGMAIATCADLFLATGCGLLLSAVASFMAMNFTGASTYTSLSGVRREMRYAVPLQLCGLLAGLGLWIAASFA